MKGERRHPLSNKRPIKVFLVLINTKIGGILVSEASLGLQIFLSRMRSVVKDLRRVRFLDREKNRDTLDRYGLTVQGICTRLAKLCPDQYVKGPEADDDGSDGSIWFFYHDEFGVRFYVKLKLYAAEGEDRLKFLSFHD
jgi:hypothetical protein